MDQETKITPERVIQQLNQATMALGGLPAGTMQGVNALIAAYQQPHRYYHNLEHIETLMVPLRECGDPEIVGALSLEDGSRETYFNALKMWAALGHDCIYTSADEESNPCQDYLAAFLKSPETVHLPSEIVNDQDRRLLQMVRTMFGLEPDQTDISEMRGKNEFLSALVTAKIMQVAGIKEKEIATVVCAINATCPFLPQKEYIKIHDRLTLVNGDLQLGMKSGEQEDIITFATHFSNEDVKNFRGEPEPFMRNGYKITAEFNTALRGKSPSPTSFLKLLQKERSNAVMFHEKRENILHHNGNGYPSASLMQDHVAKIAQNTEISRKYQEAKIVATAYIHAKAALSNRENEEMKTLIPRHDFSESENYTALKDPVFALLQGNPGKKLFTKSQSGDKVLYDLGYSPLTLCFYSHMGAEECQNLYQSIKSYVEHVAPSDQSQEPKAAAPEQCEALIEKYREVLGGNLLSAVDEKIMPDPNKSMHMKVS